MANSKRLSATVAYQLMGLVFACPSLLAMEWILPGFASSNVIFPASLAAIHALILGFMLTVAFGVLYQIVPIAFTAPQMPYHVLYWHLPAHSVSVALMIYGFAVVNTELIVTGGGLLIVGTISFLYILYSSFCKAKNKTYVHRGLYFPAIALIIAFFIGFWQAYSPGTVSTSLLLTHVIIGGLAFWGGLVFVISYRLIPMFSLSYGYHVIFSVTKWLYFVGLVVIIISEWVLHTLPEVAWFGRILQGIGCVCYGSGVISFAVDVVKILKFRAKKTLVDPMKEALFAVAFTVIGQLLLIFALLFSNLKFGVVAAYLFTFGGLVPLILAFMQKIIPFLWLQYLLSISAINRAALNVDEILPRRLSQFSIILYFIGAAIGLLPLLIVRVKRVFEVNLAAHLVPGSLMAISIMILFYSFCSITNMVRTSNASNVN